MTLSQNYSYCSCTNVLVCLRLRWTRLGNCAERSCMICLPGPQRLALPPRASAKPRCSFQPRPPPTMLSLLRSKLQALFPCFSRSVLRQLFRLILYNGFNTVQVKKKVTTLNSEDDEQSHIRFSTCKGSHGSVTRHVDWEDLVRPVVLPVPLQTPPVCFSQCCTDLLAKVTEIRENL